MISLNRQIANRPVTYNLATEKDYRVLELVEAFERVNGIKIPYVIDDRRAGDVPVVYSDPSKAERELGWRAEYEINEMVQDNWNWKKRILIGKGSAERFSTSSMDAIVSIFSFLRIL